MTYNPTIPIEVGPTSPRMHITGVRALELRCRRKMCLSCRSNGWFREARQSPIQPAVTTEEEYGPRSTCWGAAG